MARCLERVDHRHHGRGLGHIALERRDVERKPGGVGEQPQGDLRIQPPFLREAGRTKPIASVGLEMQSCHVIKHQTGRPQPGMTSARSRKCLPEFGFSEHRQASLECAVGRRIDSGLLEHPQRVDLARRLDDAGSDQIAKHLIATGGGVETQNAVGLTQRLPQVCRSRGHDLQRSADRAGLIQPQIQALLTGRQPLSAEALSTSAGLVVRRTQMLDLA